MEQDSNLNKNNLPKENNKMIWRQVMVFYAKTTSWIVIPLVLAILLNKYINKTVESKVLFFGLVMVGFGITCFGVYGEIKKYKEYLDKK